jgi:hypothetical protein
MIKPVFAKDETPRGMQRGWKTCLGEFLEGKTGTQ